jgi:hypothetical protein
MRGLPSRQMQALGQGLTYKGFALRTRFGLIGVCIRLRTSLVKRMAVTAYSLNAFVTSTPSYRRGCFEAVSLTGRKALASFGIRRGDQSTPRGTTRGSSL